MVVLGKHFKKVQIKRTLNTHGSVVFIYIGMFVCILLLHKQSIKVQSTSEKILFFNSPYS